jgi:hypothetical protein
VGDLLTPEQARFSSLRSLDAGLRRTWRTEGVERMQRSMALLKHKRIELMQVHNLVDVDAPEDAAAGR